MTSIVDGEGGRYVTLDNDEKIEVAGRDLFPLETTKTEVFTSVQSWRTRFKDAQDIVLVGGGAVGFGKALHPHPLETPCESFFM
jgi:hypothetical protein